MLEIRDPRTIGVPKNRPDHALADGEESEQSLCWLSLSVTGLNCRSCVSHLRNCLLNLSGVTEVGIDLASGTTEIVYDASLVTPPALRYAVVAAGYQLGDEASDKSIDRSSSPPRPIILRMPWAAAIASLLSGLAILATH